MSRLSITHQPKRLVENRPNATENRPNATVLRPNATETRPNATVLRHFAHVAKVDLRRIALDFLTSRIRVGEATESPRTNVRGNFLPPNPRRKDRIAMLLDLETGMIRSFEKSSPIARKRSCIRILIRLTSERAR